MSDRNISLQVSIWWLLIFFKFLSTNWYCEEIFQFMRYTCPPYGLHGECLQRSAYEKNFTRFDFYMGPVWCQFCLWDTEEAWSTAILFSYYVRMLWKDRPWFSQKTASNFLCSVRRKIVLQEGIYWKIVVFAFVLSPS